VIIVHFDPVHMEKYQPGKLEAKDFDRDEMRRACKDWVNHAVTAMDGDEVLGIFACVMNGKTAIGSTLLTDRIRKMPFAIHRFLVKSLGAIGDSGIEEMFVLVPWKNEKAIKWAERLGFEPTGNREGDELEYRKCLETRS